jgi:hypothetical protein
MLMIKVYDTILKIKHHRQKTYTTINGTVLLMINRNILGLS